MAGDAHGLDKDSGCLKVRLLEGHSAVRVTTAFNMLLSLAGVNVTAVAFHADRVIVDVRLRRRRLVCPHCGWSTRWRYDTQPHPSTWRAVDLGVWRVTVRATLRRLACRPCRRVVVEAVDFARHGARFTRDVEDLVAWPATRMDKTAICRLCRVNWRTVGAIIERVVADELDPHRLDDLYEIGIDEVSYRKQHHYLTIVANHPHRRGRVGRRGQRHRRRRTVLRRPGRGPQPPAARGEHGHGQGTPRSPPNARHRRRSAGTPTTS